MDSAISLLIVPELTCASFVLRRTSLSSTRQPQAANIFMQPQQRKLKVSLYLAFISSKQAALTCVSPHAHQIRQLKQVEQANPQLWW